MVIILTTVALFLLLLISAELKNIDSTLRNIADIYKKDVNERKLTK